MKSITGETIADPADVLDRWSAHFESVLNRDSVVLPETIGPVPQLRIRDELMDVPSVDEVWRSIAKLKNGKSAGMDGIPGEIWKYGGEVLLNRLHTLIVDVWESEEVPKEWRDGIFIPLHKKGDKSICDNYRGISLLSVAGKVLSRVIMMHLEPVLDEILPETQCGFRNNRSCMDMTFAARQLQEKSMEQQRPIYFAFIDLTKAYNTVNRHLWQLLEKYGVPAKLLNIIKDLHVGMKGTVRLNGEYSKPFGIKMGYVRAV